jgi:hypothetical protein
MIERRSVQAEEMMTENKNSQSRKKIWCVEGTEVLESMRREMNLERCGAPGHAGPLKAMLRACDCVLIENPGKVLCRGRDVMTFPYIYIYVYIYTYMYTYFKVLSACSETTIL